MSQSDQQLARAHSTGPDASDPVSAMRAHIAHLESELASALNQLNATQAGADDVKRRVTEANEAGDYEGARHAIVEHHANWETIDEEGGLVKADIRVLRALLAECYDWLETSGDPVDPGRASSQAGA